MLQKYFEINEDGCNIRCKLYCKDIHKINKVVLFSHGFGGNKDIKSAEKFAEFIISKYKGTSLISFDLPCHGDDVRKTLTLEDCELYIHLVLNYINDSMKVSEVYSYATSFGAYLILKYIYENGNPFRKIALRSPAICMYRSLTEGSLMTEQTYEKLKKGKTAPIGYEKQIKINIDFLKGLRDFDLLKLDYMDFADDIVMMHSKADENVPFDWAREFAENNVIEFEIFEHADHRFRRLEDMNRAIAIIVKFFGF